MALTSSATGMLVDSGVVIKVTEFEDDQGINVDDEEAIEVEQGEFCKPPAPARMIAKRKMGAVVVTAKKSESSQSSQEKEKPKKKAKKVKADKGE
jgi:26S proteasome regulatory subunit (ATPase 3-interacting protein)